MTYSKRAGISRAAVKGDWSSLATSETLDDLHENTLQYVKALGFDYFSYSLRYNLKQAPSDFELSNYPTRWRNRYHKQGFQHTDPCILHCFQHVTPLIWTPELFIEERAAKMRDEAKRYGINIGISFPVHSWTSGEMAAFSLASRDSEDRAMPWLKAMLSSGHQLAVHFHHVAVALLRAAPEQIEHRGPLTARELECLKHAATGKTARETAKALGVAESTVIYHFRRIAEKFNVTGRRQIVARAISLGIIRM